MDRETVEARLADLDAQLSRAQERLAKEQSTILALDGALQDARWFLTQFEGDKPLALAKAAE